MFPLLALISYEPRACELTRELRLKEAMQCRTSQHRALEKFTQCIMKFGQNLHIVRSLVAR